MLCHGLSLSKSILLHSGTDWSVPNNMHMLQICLHALCVSTWNHFVVQKVPFPVAYATQCNERVLNNVYRPLSTACMHAPRNQNNAMARLMSLSSFYITHRSEAETPAAAKRALRPKISAP